MSSQWIIHICTNTCSVSEVSIDDRSAPSRCSRRSSQYDLWDVSMYPCHNIDVKKFPSTRLIHFKKKMTMKIVSLNDELWERLRESKLHVHAFIPFRLKSRSLRNLVFLEVEICGSKNSIHTENRLIRISHLSHSQWSKSNRKTYTRISRAADIGLPEALTDAILNAVATKWTGFSAIVSVCPWSILFALLNKTTRRDIRNRRRLRYHVPMKVRYDLFIEFLDVDTSTHVYTKNWISMGSQHILNPSRPWWLRLHSQFLNHLMSLHPCNEFLALQIKSLEITSSRLSPYPSIHTTCLDHGLSYLVHASTKQ